MSNKSFNKGMAVVSLILLGLIFAGCQSANIPITIKTPGEFNLSGVSKLAIVDFNSITSQPGQGIFEADADTLAVVQGKVCAAFAKNKTYAIARLDAEKSLQDDYKAGRVSPKTRFDGIVYGRVWWQVSPEYCGTYPSVFTKRQWSNVPYETEVLGQKVKKVARVVNRTSDTLETLTFRAWNANLMLSLVVYKLDSKGSIAKLTETYTIATQKYLMNNGEFSEQQEVLIAHRASRADNVTKSSEKKSLMGGFGAMFKDDSSNAAKGTGVFNTTNVTVSLPTDLQAKFTLADKLTNDLAKKLMPNDAVIEVESSFDDSRLFYLLKEGAFNTGINYSNDIIEKAIAKLNKKARAKVKKELQELDNVDESADMPYDVNLSKIAISKDTRKFIEDNIEYFYARAICNEASGNAVDALRDYRFAFHFVPTCESANGISRCLFALDMAKEVKKVNKDVKKATKKAKLD